jgi:3-hydroxyacyl-CoA dehydrogenase
MNPEKLGVLGAGQMGAGIAQIARVLHDGLAGTKVRPGVLYLR